MIRTLIFVAAVTAGCAAAVFTGTAEAAPQAQRAIRCHPSGLVLARQSGVVLWSVRLQSRTRLYLCTTSRRRAELVASGGYNFYPGVSRLKVTGDLAAFVLTTSLSENENLIVFDFAYGRRELTQYLGCFGTRACAFAAANELTDYAVAPDGWVAEVWRLGSAYEQSVSPYVNDDETMVATDDGADFYSIDFGSTFSPLSTNGDTVTWTSDLGGLSSVALGEDLVPAASPQPLLPCQVLTANDVAPMLGPSTSTTQPGQCTYASSTDPGMSLSVVIDPPQPPASAAESMLQSAGWDGKMSDAGGFRGYQEATTIAGVTHQQLHAFLGGVELSLDLSDPGSNAGEQLAWLSDVAFDQLFAIPVQRTG